MTAILYQMKDGRTTKSYAEAKANAPFKVILVPVKAEAFYDAMMK